jgi:type I restriction enzyme R subunit
LLDDLIQQKRDDTASYEAFLKEAEALVIQMAQGQSGQGMPSQLHGNPEATVIYNNLPDILAQSGSGDEIHETQTEYGNPRLELALRIDHTMREQAPAGWRGDDTRERQVLNALFLLLDRDRNATTALFEIIKNMRGYA